MSAPASVSRADPRPLVSIVTPVYNGAAYLPALIESVLAQDYGNIEFLVIDDGSTDQGASTAVLRRYPAVRWHSRPNRGQYATLNELFESAKGELITTINQDDWYVDPGAVRRVVEFVQAQPEYEAYYGLTVHTDAAGRRLPVQPYQRFPHWMLRYHMFLSHCSLFVRRQPLLTRQLLFDGSLRYVGDRDWLTRLYLAGLRFARMDREIAAFRHHDGQVTAEGVRGSPGQARKAEELRLMEQRYAPNRTMRVVARLYNTFHRRRRVLAAAWRQGRLHGVLREGRRWLRRPFGQP